MRGETNTYYDDVLQRGTEVFLPSISVDCVIFGFRTNELKVLLLKGKYNHQWGLPGGFVYKDEDLDQSATRVLQERTGLSKLFLEQFHTFGDVKRTQSKHLLKAVEEAGIAPVKSHWLLERFTSAAYYALVQFEQVTPVPDAYSTECAWHNVAELSSLVIDHQQIIEKGLSALRKQLNYQPIGINLLPEVFTLKDLLGLYETILGKKLDPPNFQRKMLSYGILDRKEKQFSGGSHRAPYLYSFNQETYFKALQESFNKDW